MSSSIFHIGPHVLTVEDLPARAGIRWAVGNPNGRRSSTWRLWGDKKGDVYLSMRSQGGRIKASFHRDRRCSIGFTKEYEPTAKERFGADSRHWERWSLPDSEVVRVAQIIIPDTELSVFAAEEADQMRWLQEPGLGNAVIVSIFIAEPPDRFSWSGPETDGQLLGIMQTPSRFTWAVHTIQTLDLATLSHIEEGRAKALQMPSDMKIPRNDPALRVALWGHGATLADMFFIELCGQTNGVGP